MLYINKAPQVPGNYAAIVSKYKDYDSLNAAVDDRNLIKLMLLNEQGCLCPYCERQLDIPLATIEHFYPESTFPRLQLDYYNLFACCHVCNRNKTDHLIPAYVFDVRLNALDPRHLILDRHQDFQLLHYVNEAENECFLRVRNLEKRSKNKKQDDADWILFLTTEILGLNDGSRHREPRGKAHATILSLTDKMYRAKDKEGLTKLYKKYRTPREEVSTIPNQPYYRYESYLSMILYLLAHRLRGLGVDLSRV